VQMLRTQDSKWPLLKSGLSPDQVKEILNIVQSSTMRGQKCGESKTMKYSSLLADSPFQDLGRRTGQYDCSRQISDLRNSGHPPNRIIYNKHASIQLSWKPLQRKS
jgi:hypothetical protein